MTRKGPAKSIYLLVIFKIRLKQHYAIALVGAGSIGSNPILPTIWEDSVSGSTLYYASLVYQSVAQFGRALGLGPRGFVGPNPTTLTI